MMRFTIIIYPGEDGYVIAECPVLPGCVSQGKTEEEAIENIKDAIKGILKLRIKKGLPIPKEIQIDVSEITGSIRQKGGKGF